MKKAFLFLTLMTIGISGFSQTPKIEKLKKELKNHPKQDTFRVNRLNTLSGNQYLPWEQKGKYADEALVISKRINYKAGWGNALALLATVKFLEKKLEEGKLLLQEADSIAGETGDLKLKAMVLRRMSSFVTDAKEKERLINTADSIAKKSGDPFLQALVLATIAETETNYQENIDLRLKIDSLLKMTDELEFRAGNLKLLADYTSVSDAKQVEYFYTQSDTLAQQTGNLLLLSDIEAGIGSFYQQNRSDYAKGMEYYLRSLRSAESAKDTLRQINAWINLGSLYSYMGDQVKALEYLKKAEDANKKLNNVSIEQRLQTSIGERYRLMEKYPEAIKAYNKALDITRDWNYDDYINKSNLADVYTRMDSLSLAFQYAFLSLRRTKEINDISTLGWIYGILSRAYLKNNIADSAIFYGDLGLAAAKETGTIEFMRDNSLALSNAYAFKKDFQKAYTNYHLYVNYRDSMMNEEVRNRTAVQQYTFTLDKKEAQIGVLHEQKKGQRNLLIGAMALLALILAVATLLLRNNRQKQKANRLLENQKKEIDEKAQNVELLNEIGRKITASLSVENIIGTVYSNVNTLMDANAFGIGIYNDELNRLEFPATYENGEALPFYWNAVNDKNRLGSVCFTSGKEITIGNIGEEYAKYIKEVPTPHVGEQPVSIIFLPLVSKGEKLGVITVQSFQKNAYSDYQLFMLRNIATYTAIAIQNAESYETLNNTFSALKATQTQLIQSEKMASLGELTAGIAHEIQNPLNFVNNFSEVNDELIVELKDVLSKINGERNAVLEGEILDNLQQNTIKILHHGKRADSIVKGMLQHSRSSSGIKESTDINALADEYIRLSYHGLRAKDKSFNADYKTDFDGSIGKINVIPQDIGRVLLNLFNNAFQATMQKFKADGKEYSPKVLVSTKRVHDAVEIRVKDNGNGIPKNVVSKIFQPFFTTKPTGQGTGLGLSLSYDIIKAHHGEIEVKTIEGEGTEFMIHLPI